MFKDLKQGQTHYQNDGCGEPAHNSMKPMTKLLPTSWERKFTEEFQGNLWKDDGNGNFTTCNEDVKYFITKTLSSQRQEIYKTIPNPSYSQDEVNRLLKKQRQEIRKEEYQKGYKAGRQSVLDEWKEEKRKLLVGFGYKKITP